MRIPLGKFHIPNEIFEYIRGDISLAVDLKWIYDVALHSRVDNGLPLATHSSSYRLSCLGSINLTITVIGTRSTCRCQVKLLNSI